MPLPDFNGPQLPRLRMPGLGGQAPARAPLSPDERQGLGQQLLGTSTGALNWVLDKAQMPGDYIRGGLGGQLGTRLTGKQLLEKHGLLKPHDNSWGAWGLGLGADIATDPFTYATFGAKHAFTGGGAALERAGHLAGWSRKAHLEGYHGIESTLRAGGSTTADIAHMYDHGQRIAAPAAESAYHAATGRALTPNTPLSSLGKLSIPFHPDQGLHFGSGPLAQQVAGGLDRAGGWLKHDNPAGRFLGGLFNNDVQRAQSSLMSRNWEQRGTPAMKAASQQAHVQHLSAMNALNPLIQAHPDHEIAVLRAAKIRAENTSPHSYYEHQQPSQYMDLNAPEGRAIADWANLNSQSFDSMLDAEQKAGLGMRDAGDAHARYFPRQAHAARIGETGPQLDRRNIVPTTSGSNIGREDWSRNVPGGTDRLNDWAHRFAGHTDSPTVSAGVLRDLERDHGAVTGAAATPQQSSDLLQKANQVTEWLSTLPEDQYLGQIATHPFYSHHIFGDILRRGEQHARTMGSAATAFGALASTARPVADLAGVEHTLVPHAFGRLGLASHDTGNDLIGAGPQLARQLAPKNFGMVEPLTQGGTPYALDAELRNWAVPTHDLDNIAHRFNSWQAPTETHPFWNMWDSATNAFKAMAYPIWPASHVRNAATAAMNNVRTGVGVQDYAKQFKFLRNTLDPAEADVMRRGQYAYAGIGREGGVNNELAGTQSRAGRQSWRQASDPTPLTGSASPTGGFLRDTLNLVGNEGLAQMVPQTARWLRGPEARNILREPGAAYRSSPLAVSGVAGSTVDRLAPVAAGREVSSNIENLFRGAQYNAAIRKGSTPENAAALVHKYHFDYGDVTPFEKNVARRAIPFYTFARKNLPLQLESLATRPGAFSTPFKPALVDRDKQEYVPDYLSNQFVTPLGPEVDGKRRFLSTLGLPQEEAFKEMSLWNGHPDLQNTLMRYAGNLNPLIKGPIEQITNTQLYSGRKLSDLQPSAMGRALSYGLGEEYAQPLTQLLANTPMTRLQSSADKLLDTQGLTATGRKPLLATAANLLTGLRVTDVDLNRQRILEQRKAADALMSGQPNIKSYLEHYIPKERKMEASPQENLLMRWWVDYQQQAKTYMEQRRRREGMGVR